MMHHSAKDNYVHLTTTPVPRLITSLAVPTIISMLVTSFYNMADTYFVGKEEFYKLKYCSTVVYMVPRA